MTAWGQLGAATSNRLEPIPGTELSALLELTEQLGAAAAAALLLRFDAHYEQACRPVGDGPAAPVRRLVLTELAWSHLPGPEVGSTHV